MVPIGQRGEKGHVTSKDRAQRHPLALNLTKPAPSTSLSLEGGRVCRGCVCVGGGGGGIDEAHRGLAQTRGTGRVGAGVGAHTGATNRSDGNARIRLWLHLPRRGFCRPLSMSGPCRCLALLRPALSVPACLSLFPSHRLSLAGQVPSPRNWMHIPVMECIPWLCVRLLTPHRPHCRLQKGLGLKNPLRVVVVPPPPLAISPVSARRSPG